MHAFGPVPVRFVGGAVRDSIIGIKVNDVDLATPVLPESVMELLSRAGIKVVPTGIDHGTVTAVIGRHNFEITTLRKDVSTDGRRATVAYTDDWKEDAARRDFTMNALYCDMQGEITDYFGGVEDAKNGYVRFIGDPNERIREDALRILRFFRFLAYYGKQEAGEAALAACELLAGTIDNLSGERIQQEMMKLLASPKSAPVIALMQDRNMLSHVIPKTVATAPLGKLPSILDRARKPLDPVLALALLLRSAGDDVTAIIDAVATRWKLSKAHFRLLSDLCRKILFLGEGEKEWKKHIRNLGDNLFIKQALQLMAEGADMESGLRAIKLAEEWRIPEFPVTGEDLIAHGLKPGKEMGQILKQLEQDWEEKGYALTKGELVNYIKMINK